MTEATGRPARRTLVTAGALVVVVLVAVAVWFATRGGDDGGSTASVGTTSASTGATPATPGEQPSVAPSNPPTPVPSGPTADATEGPGSLAPVGLADTAETGGVTGRLVSVDAVQGDGEGVGNVDGPALQVRVELVNGTAAPLPVDSVAVELYSGADLTPASPLEDARARPFTGILQPGASTTGIYVFTIAEDQRDDVTVQVGYQAGAPYMVFRGSAS